MTAVLCISCEMVWVSAQNFAQGVVSSKRSLNPEVAEYQITKGVSVEETEHGGNWDRCCLKGQYASLEQLDFF